MEISCLFGCIREETGVRSPRRRPGREGWPEALREGTERSGARTGSPNTAELLYSAGISVMDSPNSMVPPPGRIGSLPSLFAFPMLS